MHSKVSILVCFIHVYSLVLCKNLIYLKLFWASFLELLAGWVFLLPIVFGKVLKPVFQTLFLDTLGDALSTVCSSVCVVASVQSVLGALSFFLFSLVHLFLFFSMKWHTASYTFVKRKNDESWWFSDPGKSLNLLNAKMSSMCLHMCIQTLKKLAKKN